MEIQIVENIFLPKPMTPKTAKILNHTIKPVIHRIITIQIKHATMAITRNLK